MQPKYPDVRVQLVGQNGNAFVVLGLVQRALKRADVPAEEIKQFVAEATSGDYNNVLRTAMAWVDVR